MSSECVFICTCHSAFFFCTVLLALLNSTFLFIDSLCILWLPFVGELHFPRFWSLDNYLTYSLRLSQTVLQWLECHGKSKIYIYKMSYQWGSVGMDIHSFGGFWNFRKIRDLPIVYAAQFKHRLWVRKEVEWLTAGPASTFLRQTWGIFWSGRRGWRRLQPNPPPLTRPLQTSYFTNISSQCHFVSWCPDARQSLCHWLLQTCDMKHWDDLSMCFIGVVEWQSRQVWTWHFIRMIGPSTMMGSLVFSEL